MGIVYEAEQQHPRRLVALKVIEGGQWVSEEYVKLFLNLASASEANEPAATGRVPFTAR